MMTLDEVRRALVGRNLSDTARRCGLHWTTVRRVAVGDFDRVSYETVKKLSDYLECEAMRDNQNG